MPSVTHEHEADYSDWHDRDGYTGQAGLGRATRGGLGQISPLVPGPVLAVGKVIAVHPEERSVDLRMLRGGLLRHVRVASAETGTAGGVGYLMTIKNTLPDQGPNGPLDSAQDDGTQTTYALVMCIEGDSSQPVVTGFLDPATSQMLFAEAGLRVERHVESGIYEMWDKSSNYEMVLPDGSYLHWGPSLSGHRDLSYADAQGRWKIPTQSALTFKLFHSSGAFLQIAADGAVSLVPASGKTVSLGGGTHPVARSGDAVSVTGSVSLSDPQGGTVTGTVTLSGTITAGSTTVLAT